MPKRRGNPQLEEGHTRIANELLEALMRYPFSGGELKVLLAIVRLTYGWHRKERPIRQTDLARLTGLHVRYVHDLLANLRRQAVVCCDRAARPHRYRLNKAYFGWRDWPPECEPAQCAHSAQAACEFAGQPAEESRFAPVPWDRVSKEKKEKDCKERAVEPAVQNLFQRFSELLKRPLTEEEQRLVCHLHELSPTQAQQLLQQVADRCLPAAPAAQAGQATQPEGGPHAHGPHHPG